MLGIKSLDKELIVRAPTACTRHFTLVPILSELKTLVMTRRLPLQAIYASFMADIGSLDLQNQLGYIMCSGAVDTGNEMASGAYT
jgi:hypothetical protein